MKKPIVFMFSGQGSQYYHMGKALYENHPRFKLWMDHCNEVVHPLIKVSLIDILYMQENKHEVFDEVLYTSPALLSIEYSLARLLMELDIQPDYLLGYSLGEITAAVVSGAVSLEDGVRFVVDSAKLLRAETPPAEMLSIIESTDIMDRFADDFRGCWLTGENFQGNFVVSGLVADIQNLRRIMEMGGITTRKLAVNYGFHTQLIDPMENGFRQLACRVNFFENRIPVVSACQAKEITEISEDYLWQVFRRPVKFEQTIQAMLVSGDYAFIDVGPSGSLATFVKYILPDNSDSLYLEALNQFGRDLLNIEKLEARLVGDGLGH